MEKITVTPEEFFLRDCYEAAAALKHLPDGEADPGWSQIIETAERLTNDAFRRLPQSEADIRLLALIAAYWNEGSRDESG